MAIKITPPQLTDEAKAAIVHGIIDVTARPFVIKTHDAQQVCPTCEGNDPFCPTCDGKGVTFVQSTVTLRGTVKYPTARGANNKIYRPEGQYVEGALQITVPYSDDGEVFADVYPSLVDLLNHTKTITVDGSIFVLDKFFPGGNPPNRMYLVLKQDDTESGHRIG